MKQLTVLSLLIIFFACNKDNNSNVNLFAIAQQHKWIYDYAIYTANGKASDTIYPNYINTQVVTTFYNDSLTEYTEQENIPDVEVSKHFISFENPDKIKLYAVYPIQGSPYDTVYIEQVSNFKLILRLEDEFGKTQNYYHPK